MERIALLSVYDKSGIVEFAKSLVALKWRLVSSGGTAVALRNAGIPVTDVVEISGLLPILGHRVVTLVPQIHGGLLATPDMLGELTKLGYPLIDLVCVDLYPLKEEIIRAGATRASVIEKTDIGGPTLLRSAAKGGRIVIADPSDRARVLQWLTDGEPEADEFKYQLAAKAEYVVASYILASTRYHGNGQYSGVVGRRVTPCRYGENAWQVPAGLYSTDTDDPLALDKFELIEGEKPSYNNWCDIDRLLQTLTHVQVGLRAHGAESNMIALGAKHGNVCGATVGNNVTTVLSRMLLGDPLAIFGGVVMTTIPIGEYEARILTEWGMNGEKRLLDAVVAPSFSESARAVLGRKNGKCRMIANPALQGVLSYDTGERIRYVRGGFLTQPNYTYTLDLNDPHIEHVGPKLNPEGVQDAVLAWAIGATSNSNTVTIVKKRELIGNGVGQQDRVGAANLALVRVRRSWHNARDATAYSDSFFPFPDGVRALIDAGVRTILATSGSVNDQMIRDTCEATGVTLVLVPDALGRGFFGH